MNAERGWRGGEGGEGKSRSCAYCGGRGDVSALALTNCLMIVVFFFGVFFFAPLSTQLPWRESTLLFYFLTKDGEVQEL